AGAEEQVAEERLKPVLEQLPAVPLPAPQRRFVEWVARYTMAPLGAVLRMSLPVTSALRPERPQRALRLAGAPPDSLKLTAARQRVLDVADDGFARSAAELAREAGVGAGVVKGLADAGVLEWVALPVRLQLEPP